jgi:hypothetical protein
VIIRHGQKRSLRQAFSGHSLRYSLRTGEKQ